MRPLLLVLVALLLAGCAQQPPVTTASRPSTGFDFTKGSLHVTEGTRAQRFTVAPDYRGGATPTNGPFLGLNVTVTNVGTSPAHVVDPTSGLSLDPGTVVIEAAGVARLAVYTTPIWSNGTWTGRDTLQPGESGVATLLFQDDGRFDHAPALTFVVEGRASAVRAADITMSTWQ